MLIGLHGKLGSGKDYVFETMASVTPDVEVLRVSFADKLKDSACALLGISRETMEALKRDDAVELSWGHEDVGVFEDFPMMNMRTFLQRYGTESHRDIFGKDFWLDAALPLDFDHAGKIVMCTDTRFENEAARVRSLGGVVVEVLGPVDDTGGHVSETPLPRELVDYQLDNTAHDPQTLRANLEELMRIIEVDYSLA